MKIYGEIEMVNMKWLLPLIGT